MKIRSLLVATFALLVLVGILYWSDHRSPSEDSSKTSPNTAPTILKLDQTTITGLELKTKNADPIVLRKNNSGTWQITQPETLNADESSVSGVISSLASLDSERLVDNKPSDLKQYGLDSPGFEADITEKDNKTQRLLLGDDTPTGNGVYAMLAGDPRVFTIASYKKNSIDKSLNDLRDMRLITISADRVSRIELVRKSEEIEFGRDKNNDEWQILKPQPVRADSVQVGELVGKVTDAKMDLSGSAAEAKESAAAFAKGTPVATVRLTDPSGIQQLQVRKSKDAYYATSSAVEGAYKIGADLAQALDKGSDDFRNKKLFDFGFSEPSKIEMRNGSTTSVLTRSGSDWWSSGKKMDAEAVQSYISSLRELSAGKFVDSGFANPALEIAVTSGDGKQVENVSLAKSGDFYVAKRDNESGFYQLDAGAVDALQKAAAQLKPASTAAK
jgi:hypothetical protein